MLIDLFKNDKITKVLKNDPDLLKIFKDCISKINLSISEVIDIEKKINDYKNSIYNLNLILVYEII